MANSAVQSSVTDKRNTEPNTKTVWEQNILFTIETGGGAAELSFTVPTNGILRESVIQVGAAAGVTGTVNVDFEDSNGVPFDTNSALVEGSSTIVTYTDKAVNGFVVRVDPSAAPTSGVWEITVTCRGN